jgi:hypothetical protein
MRYKWNDEERFAFATQNLRANRIPNKKREADRRACRGRVTSW